jgi:hypothetical protein
MQRNQEEVGLNGTYQLIVFVAAVNLPGRNTSIVRKSIGALLNACKEVCLEVNAKKSKYTSMSDHQNANYTVNIEIRNNESYENVVKFRSGTDSNKSKLHQRK